MYEIERGKTTKYEKQNIHLTFTAIQFYQGRNKRIG